MQNIDAALTRRSAFLAVVFLLIVAVSTIGRISTFGALQAPASWRGLIVAPERRSSPYDADNYRYPQSVEDRIWFRRLVRVSAALGRSDVATKIDCWDLPSRVVPIAIPADFGQCTARDRPCRSLLNGLSPRPAMCLCDVESLSQLLVHRSSRNKA